MSEKAKILIVDDEKIIRLTLRTVLERGGYTVVTATNGLEGFNSYQEHNPDLVILDLNMPVMNGAIAQSRIMSASPHARILIHTGVTESERVKGLIQKGALGAIKKPINQAELLKSVQVSLQTNPVDLYGTPLS